MLHIHPWAHRFRLPFQKELLHSLFDFRYTIYFISILIKSLYICISQENTTAMKKILLLLILAYAANSNAQVMNVIDANKSSRYYCTKVIKKVFFKSPRTLVKNTPMPVSTKASEFVVVAEEYGKDKQNVFWGNKKLINGDIASFDWNHKAQLPFDKDFIYQEIPIEDRLIPIENMDKNSYERVKLSAECLIWHKDINHYYYNYQITEANRQKLSFESEYLPFDDTYIFIVNGRKWEPYRYTGKVRVVANNIVYDDKVLIISGVCEDEDSKPEKIEIDNPSHLTFDIENKSNSISYTELVFKTAKYIFYKGQFLYLPIIDEITDLSLFKQLYENYYQYANKVYYYKEDKFVEISGADPKTFKTLKRGYSIDANYVYYIGKRIEGSDPETFKISFFSEVESDKNNIYKDGDIISTDAQNFELLNSQYSKDRFKAYYHLNQIIGIDINSFKSMSDGYAKDKNLVYYEGVPIENADAKSFECISHGYAKDKNLVYYFGKILKGYEPKKFKKDKCGRFPNNSEYGNECPRGRSYGFGDDDDD